MNITFVENSSGTYANMTTAVYSHPEVVPTLLRQNVDYSFYFVLMGKSNTSSLPRFSNITEYLGV